MRRLRALWQRDIVTGGRQYQFALGDLHDPIDLSANRAASWIAIQNNPMRPAICLCHLTHELKGSILRAIVGQNDLQRRIGLRKGRLNSLANEALLVQRGKRES